MNKDSLQQAMSPSKGYALQSGCSALQQQSAVLGSNVPAPTSQIEAELNRLHSALDSLSDHYSALDMRLHPIRVYPGGVAGQAPGDNKAEQALSPVAERIKVARQVVERLTSEVIGTTNALAV
jgi:hypothetical protein